MLQLTAVCSRVYRDDPTIIAWNLINEPRCETWLAANKDCNKRFQSWLSEMSTHVRSLDPNHLVTIGSEGFFGDSTPDMMQYNPQAWARELGQDFVMNTNLPNIDFATVHAWPDNWMLPQVSGPEVVAAVTVLHTINASNASNVGYGIQNPLST